jgi:predicted nucleic acid-binding protein
VGDGAHGRSPGRNGSHPLEIVSVECELAPMAGYLKAKHAIAYADALAAALAQHHTAKLVTGNPASQLLERVLDLRWLPQREP